MDERRISGGIARYTSTTHLLQHYLEEDSAHLWAAKRGVLHDVRAGWILSLLILDGKSYDMLWMPRFGGRVLMSEKYRAL